MHIGISFDLKDKAAAADGRPDDWQEEFDSPAAIATIAAALEQLGHRVSQLGDGAELVRRLLADPPDFVFNVAEGEGIGRCREARVPAVCELLGIPCTGSDPLTMAATLDKDIGRRLAAAAGLRLPRGVVINPTDDPAHVDLPFPTIVKPAWEGSSKGLRGNCLVHSSSELAAMVESLRRDYRQPLLAEEFIDGHEITVGILGNEKPRVLGVCRVRPREHVDQFIYNLEYKRDVNLVVYESPAPLPKETLAVVQKDALTAYRAFGCRDVGRVDFRVRDGLPYFLEVNPLPGINPETSDLVFLAEGVGMSHAKLVQTILHEAVSRTPSASKPPRGRKTTHRHDRPHAPRVKRPAVTRREVVLVSPAVGRKSRKLSAEVSLFPAPGERD